ncbi:MAG: helix-turn-helix domain-containing protein [Pseudomonadota bacterium]
MQSLTVLLIGFSVFSAAILLFAYAFFLENMKKTAIGIASCAVLLASLCGLQLLHLRFLGSGEDLLASPLYVALLLTAPPAFYFFGREILLPDAEKSWPLLLHAVPPVASGFLPAAVLPALPFVIGAGYALWLMRLVYGMRKHSHRFRFEMFFFGLFAVLAVAVLVLVAGIPYLNPAIFYLAYAFAIGVAFVLIVAALIVFPDLLGDISDAAHAAYARSTLGEVDVEDALKQLRTLMDEDKIYQNENLNLALLAETLGLSSHQLSELINTSFGYGFSRFVREHRIAEAKRLLREDQRSSILAISMMTGFKSQSSFYAAFKDSTGEAPGIYRKQAASARGSS